MDAACASSGHDDSIAILPATSNDVPILANVELAAQISSPFNSRFFRPHAEPDAMLTYFSEMLKAKLAATDSSALWCLKAVDVHTGKPEGFVIWSMHAMDEPINDTSTQEDMKVQVEDDETNTIGDKGRWHMPRADGPAAELVSEDAAWWASNTYPLRWRLVHGLGRHVLVDKMYVRPRSQRRGIATRLWEAGPARELAHTPVATMALGDSHVFYASLGFRHVEYWETDLRVRHRAGGDVIQPSDLGSSGTSFGGFGIWRFHGMVHENSMSVTTDAIAKEVPLI